MLACRNANAVGEGGMALRAGGGGEGTRITSGASTPNMRMWIVFLTKSAWRVELGLGCYKARSAEVVAARAPLERFGMNLNLSGPRQPKPGVW